MTQLIKSYGFHYNFFFFFTKFQLYRNKINLLVCSWYLLTYYTLIISNALRFLTNKKVL